MIYFVGGGVGTADYLTVAAVRVLKKADIILFSKYLDKSVVDAYAKKNIRVLCFSDMVRSHVDQIFLENSRRNVVYLANGDFACYGTVQDHFDFCKEHHLPFKVIPGVSGVGACAAVLANEFVLPNISNSLVITYAEASGNIMDKQTVTEWARHGATLAIHMAAPDMYGSLREKLIAGGMDPKTPVVIVREALRPRESVVRTTVEGLGDIEDASWMSLVLVGNVFLDADVRQKFSGLPFTTEFRRAEYYNQLRGWSGVSYGKN